MEPSSLKASSASPRYLPGVGVIVWYQSFGTPGGEYKSVPRAAIVTQNNADETIGLCILNPTGMFFNTSVREGAEPGCWSWIPGTHPRLKDEMFAALEAKAHRASAASSDPTAIP